MSVKVSSWVWHGDECAELNGNELVLMLALADVAGDEGRCRFVDNERDLTYAALAEKVRVSIRTIASLVSSLREAGLLEQARGSKSRPNEFTIQVPWAKRATSASNVEGDSMQSGADSMQPSTGFDATSDTHSSIERIDVSDVETSAVAAASTLGQKFAQPLCDVLVTELLKNNVKVPVPLPKKWLDDARLMVDRDERDPRQAKALIEWACRDGFWRGNIHSMPTFRKQYDKLRLQSEAPGGRGSAKPTTIDHGRDVDSILRERRAQRESQDQLAVGA